MRCCFSIKSGIHSRTLLTGAATSTWNLGASTMPQEDPTFYDFALHTYTMPTLAVGPVTVPQKDLIKAIKETNPPADVRINR